MGNGQVHEIEVAHQAGVYLESFWWKTGKARKVVFFQEYEKSFLKAVECLEDSVQFYAFEELDSRKISSTNTLERLNREIRRHSAVVGIFPSTDSYIRLITSYLLEYSDDWQTERCYMNASSKKLQKKILFNAAWWICDFFKERNCELNLTESFYAFKFNIELCYRQFTI